MRREAEISEVEMAIAFHRRDLEERAKADTAEARLDELRCMMAIDEAEKGNTCLSTSLRWLRWRCRWPR